VLVLPFRRKQDGFEFAALRRADDGNWQFVAGGEKKESRRSGRHSVRQRRSLA
jgi:8-oxo-dGTP pyrophosphatase MutT (NUDIX family)